MRKLAVTAIALAGFAILLVGATLFSRREASHRLKAERYDELCRSVAVIVDIAAEDAERGDRAGAYRSLDLAPSVVLGCSESVKLGPLSRCRIADDMPCLASALREIARQLRGDLDKVKP